MSRHNISFASTILHGKAYYEPYAADYEGNRGIAMTPITYVSLGTPAIGDVDGICASQAVAGAGDLTIAGALASGGTVTMDSARNVVIDSSDAGDTTQTITITGTDYYGEALVETISANGTTAVEGLKAFATVTQVTASAAFTGNVTVGTADFLGLPFAISSKNKVITFIDGAVDDGVTTVAAVTSTATATTGDIRGTVDTNPSLDGTKEVSAAIFVDAATKESAFGVAQYGG
jgi:hypothetical protein